jgi:hypothetical protein
MTGKTELERIAEDYGGTSCARMTIDHEISLRRSKALRFVNFYDTDVSPESCINVIISSKRIIDPSPLFRLNMSSSLHQIKDLSMTIRKLNELRTRHFDWNDNDHSALIRTVR